MTTLTLDRQHPATPRATPVGAVEGTPRLWLRLEGAALLVAGVALFGGLGGNWLFLLPLLLLPDVSMVGYLRSPRLGALTYNAVHTLVPGIAVLGAGAWLSILPLELAGAILVAHVGMDRLASYGLKYATGFRETHLGRIGR